MYTSGALLLQAFDGGRAAECARMHQDLIEIYEKEHGILGPIWPHRTIDDVGTAALSNVGDGQDSIRGDFGNVIMSSSTSKPTRGRFR